MHLDVVVEDALRVPEARQDLERGLILGWPNTPANGRHFRCGGNDHRFGASRLNQDQPNTTGRVRRGMANSGWGIAKRLKALHGGCFADVCDDCLSGVPTPQLKQSEPVERSPEFSLLRCLTEFDCAFT